MSRAGSGGFGRLLGRGLNAKPLAWHHDRVAMEDVPRSLRTLIPSRVRTQLTYADMYSIPAGSGVTFYAYKVNGLFDPDAQTGGHQPYLFDQWKVFYPNYLVLLTLSCVALALTLLNLECPNPNSHLPYLTVRLMT